MATVNKRVYHPEAMTINSVACGGLMTVEIEEGYENIINSSPDGLGPPVVDREVQFCRGRFIFQDWIDAINLLVGTVGTAVFYDRKSGVAAASGYTKHTLTNPVVYGITLNINKAGYATVSAPFECKAEDETKTIADMHAQTDSQAAPTYVPASRGAYRIITTAHGGSIDVYHLLSLTFTIAMRLKKACNDADIAYTAVDACTEGMTVNGSATFQDAEITAAKLKAQQLLLAAVGNLVVTVAQSQGAANKVITIARTLFTSSMENSDVNADYSSYSGNFVVSNDPSTPLTLDGANKIITIEDEA